MVHIDYANAVLAPYKPKHIDLIEGVQRIASQPIPELSKLPYPEVLQTSKIPNLSYRGIGCDMIEIYKLVKGLYDLYVSRPLRKPNQKMWSKEVARSSFRGNSLTIYPQTANTHIRKQC